MFRQYYPLMSPDPITDGGGVPESYDATVNVEGKDYGVHVEKGKITPLQTYEDWNTPILNDKISEQLVHAQKKAMETLKNSNETTRQLQEKEDELRKLREDNLRKEGIIETLQRVVPPKEEKPKPPAKDDFDVVAEARKAAGLKPDDEEGWDDLTPTQRFNAQSVATQKLIEHTQLKSMQNFNEANAKANQQFAQEQKLATTLMQKGHDPQQAKTWMEQNGVMYGENGVNLYLKHMDLVNSKPSTQRDPLDIINRRTEIIDKTPDTTPKGSQSGFVFVSTEQQQTIDVENALRKTSIDRNTLATEMRMRK
jgi:hypothetical protein